MTEKANKSASRAYSRDDFDLDALLHPAAAFAHPTAVVNDPDLTLNEKRAILASWASDACAIEAAPGLRQPPGGRIIRFEEIIDALRMLDRQAAASTKPQRHYRRLLQNRVPGRRRGESGDGSMSIN
ncbi:MAG: hypothetical protein J2P54_26800 [Bradyrhizobiaceae bacterium]|nr:hypothetical protein [Bradyrhizobiaceae bacterium]